jgi:hypothetical protein
MRKLYSNSRIEIWDMYYINNVDDRRQEVDRNVDIVQIEYAHNNDFIVEIVEKAEQEEIPDIKLPRVGSPLHDIW